MKHPDLLVCLTDGSKYTNKTEHAYSINEKIVTRRIRNIASVVAADLMAIFSCLFHMAYLPPAYNNKYLLTDSLSFLHLITDPHTTNPLIQRIHLTQQQCYPHMNPRIYWLPPPRDAVDSAAKQATSLPKITDHSPIPFTDCRNHFKTFILKSWNSLW